MTAIRARRNRWGVPGLRLAAGALTALEGWPAAGAAPHATRGTVGGFAYGELQSATVGSKQRFSASGRSKRPTPGM